MFVQKMTFQFSRKRKWPLFVSFNQSESIFVHFRKIVYWLIVVDSFSVFDVALRTVTDSGVWHLLSLLIKFGSSCFTSYFLNWIPWSAYALLSPVIAVQPWCSNFYHVGACFCGSACNHNSVTIVASGVTN